MYFFCTGRLSPTFASAYCISKYGVEAFSDALRREMRPWGVLVSVIEPGAFQTAGIHKIAGSMKQLWNNLNPEMKEDYQNKRLDGSRSSMLLQGHAFISSRCVRWVNACPTPLNPCEDYRVCFRRNWHGMN